MKLVLSRHAQKGITPYHDPQLTENGLLQAADVCALAKKNILPPPTHAWVSTRIRTAQTLQVVCEYFGVKMQNTAALDQRLQSETPQEFRDRVGTFLNQFIHMGLASSASPPTDTGETHYLCTHYDWIEEAMTLIECEQDLNSFEFSHWAPTQFVVFDITNPVWSVIKKGVARATKTD